MGQPRRLKKKTMTLTKLQRSRVQDFLDDLRALCARHHVTMSTLDESSYLYFARLDNTSGDIEFRGASPDSAQAWHEDDERPMTSIPDP